MREPPRKLDARDLGVNPDCANVSLTLRGEKQTSCVSYDLDEGSLLRYNGKIVNNPVTGDYEMDVERVDFQPGELVVEWIDKERVQD